MDKGTERLKEKALASLNDGEKEFDFFIRDVFDLGPKPNKYARAYYDEKGRDLLRELRKQGHPYYVSWKGTVFDVRKNKQGREELIRKYRRTIKSAYRRIATLEELG